MGEPRRSQSKHIGFKAKGVDPQHDLVYSVLDALPRGGASEFIVLAVMEFLKNHSGEAITGRGKRKYIILGDYSKLPDNKVKEAAAENISIPLPEPADETTGDDIAVIDVPLAETEPPELLPPVQDDTPLLDEDTLESLVLGFSTDFS